MVEQYLTYTGCSRIHFFNSPSFPNTVSCGCVSAHILNLLLTKKYYLVGSIYVLGSATEDHSSLSMDLF